MQSLNGNGENTIEHTGPRPISGRHSDEYVCIKHTYVGESLVAFKLNYETV